MVTLPYVIKKKTKKLKNELFVRTVGDMSCTAVDSYAATISEVVGEIRLSSISERGARIDDKRSEAAMEKENNKGTLE
jgi:sulfate adenylyltransferase subunit 2